MTLLITPEDIQSVAQLMGKDFSDPERTSILQTISSCDIQACPGSGKTTTMVAKINIMAGKLRGTNRGICALSHTNAARDEIGSSLGTGYNSIYRFPHFIGTIQVFVDTFLAVPAYIKKYGHRPVMIDDDGYDYVAGRRFFDLTSGTQYFLVQNRSRHVQVKQLKVQYAKDYFAKLSYRFSNIKELIYFENNQEKNFIAGPTSTSYIDVLKVKHEITETGYLTYHDAFSFANWYLDQFPHLCEALALRFPFVFVDEMQDTDRYQLALIERIFGGRSVVQKFGDPNQAIYNHRSEEFERVWNPQANFQITTSRRLSPSIASLSQSLGVIPQIIQGNPTLADHHHTIICFDPGQVLQVIPAFANILEQEELNEGPFMALGAVAKPHDQQLTIPDYWPGFERRLNRQTSTSTFWEDLALAQLLLSWEMNLISARTYLINALGKVLRYQNSRTSDSHPYSAQVFEAEIRRKGLQATHVLNGTMLNWAQTLIQSPTIDADRLISDLQTVFGLIGIQLTADVIAKIRQGPDDCLVNIRPSGTVQEVQTPTNIYHHSENIAININTIHSAKGQTHKATLLLETFYNQYDLQQIRSYLWGQPVRKPGVRILQRFLPLAYVACTRPTHLLCLAIQGTHLTIEERSCLQDFGWRIVDL